MITITVAAVLGYLLGSIPSALLAGRWLRGIDIREHGSGNVGASNVRRVLGWRPAMLVLAVDLGKGALAVEIGSVLALDSLPIDLAWVMRIAGLSAILGHLWPAFAGFRGGKGVATATGVMLMLHPLTVAIAVSLFIVVVAMTRRVSVGSMTAALALPLLLIGLGQGAGSVAYAAGITLLLLASHRSNLENLWKGREPKL